MSYFGYIFFEIFVHDTPEYGGMDDWRVTLIYKAENWILKMGCFGI